MARVDWLNGLIAPLHWLERARGWRRVGLLGLYLVLIGGIGVCISRESVFWLVPDIAEPLVPEPVVLLDAKNAVVEYRNAIALLDTNPRILTKSRLIHQAGRDWNWSRAIPENRAVVVANPAALDVWREGTSRPDAVLPLFVGSPPGQPTFDPSDLLLLAYLGTLQAGQRQEAGDPAGAWADLRGALRTGMHASRHGGLGLNSVGAQIWTGVIPQARNWIDDPALTPALAHAAITDLADCRRDIASISDLIRVEYRQVREKLTHSETWEHRWTQQQGPLLWDFDISRLQNFLRNEPARSLRIFRLITAGQLAQIDRPAAKRPRMVSPRYLIFDIDAATPPALARIAPLDLAAWADASGCRVEVPEVDFFLGSIQATRTAFDSLRLELAKRCFSLDHGGTDARSFGDLIPIYLDRLPEGIIAGDPLIAP